MARPVPHSGHITIFGGCAHAFGVSLRKLTLHAQLGNFANLISTVDFDNLEELELYFDHDAGDTGSNAALLRGSIAPFVNHFHRSIGSLLISSASKTDLSPLFDSPQAFPHLHKFVARSNSDIIFGVDLGLSFAAASDEAPDPLSTWAALSAALAGDPGVLVNLTTLKIPALQGFDATMACLRRSADTLTSLSLVDYFLIEVQLIELVQIFWHRPFDKGLKHLYIGVVYLSPSMFDLLSSHLPGLLDLSLVF
ncbi:hypothetical protein DFH09DRAFT_1086206 [Mycena vulgaris]|nr:hypothetical protein DFH09DRAFT_1086206 [Mycena vulgaris]